MILKTNCGDCGEPLTVTLAETTESEAQTIANRVLCVPCAVQRMAETTARTCDADAASAKPEGKAGDSVPEV